MACVYIPVQNSEEEVRVALDQLPRDAADILDILKAEQAPLDLGLIIAVRFCKFFELYLFLFFDWVCDIRWISRNWNVVVIVEVAEFGTIESWNVVVLVNWAEYFDNGGDYEFVHTVISTYSIIFLSSVFEFWFLIAKSNSKTALYFHKYRAKPKKQALTDSSSGSSSFIRLFICYIATVILHK